MIDKPLSFKTFAWRLWYKMFTKEFTDVTWYELFFEIPEVKK